MRPEVTKRIVVPNSILLGEVSRVLSEGRNVIISTKGSSMLPFITGGRDSVMLEPAGSVCPMDIVLAEISKDRYVLHRVKAIEGDRIVLKGDGNLYGTEECHPEDIRGIAVKIIRKSGRVRPCDGTVFKAVCRCWTALPAIIRRLFLAVYRRTVIRITGID